MFSTCPSDMRLCVFVRVFINRFRNFTKVTTLVQLTTEMNLLDFFEVKGQGRDESKYEQKSSF